MKIRDIRDPSLFQRLVQKLYIAERGQEFQVVDDAAGDRGNDGYDLGRRLLVAIYCPERPDTADYRRKAMSDLQKAARLSTAPGYAIVGWVFVTPTPLRESLQAELREAAKNVGLETTLVSDAHLEDMYRRHAHISDDFPELEYPRVAEQLAAIRAELAGTVVPPEPPELLVRTDEPAPASVTTTFGILRGFIAPTLERLRDRLLDGDAGALPELERFRLEAADPRDRLGALLTELEFETDRLNVQRCEQLAREGFRLAKDAGVQAEASVLAAHLAYTLVLQLVPEDLDTIARVGFGNVTGTPLMSRVELEEVRRRLDATKTEIDDLLRQAAEMANASEDVVAQFIVALRIGSTHAQRYLPYRLAREFSLGNDSRSFFLEQVERAYGHAIPRAKLLGADQLAQAYHNFANDLVLLDEYGRALPHAKHALSLAQEAGFKYQVTKSEQLIAKIERETGQR